MESVCVESCYLEQSLMDQRAFAAAYDATFVQVRHAAARDRRDLCASGGLLSL